MAEEKKETTVAQESETPKVTKKKGASEAVVHAQSQLIEIGDKVTDAMESPIETLEGESLHLQLKELIRLAAKAENIAAITSENLFEAQQSGDANKRVIEDCEMILKATDGFAGRIGRIISLLEAKVRMETERHQKNALGLVKYHSQLSKKISDSVEFMAVFGSTWFLWDLADNFIKILMKNHIQGLPYEKVEAFGIPVLLVFTWLILRVLRDHPKLESEDSK